MNTKINCTRFVKVCSMFQTENPNAEAWGLEFLSRSTILRLKNVFLRNEKTRIRTDKDVFINFYCDLKPGRFINKIYLFRFKSVIREIIRLFRNANLHVRRKILKEEKEKIQGDLFVTYSGSRWSFCWIWWISMHDSLKEFLREFKLFEIMWINIWINK